MRVVPLDRPLKGKDINRYIFLIFNFSAEYLKQLTSSEPLHAKRPLILMLVRVLKPRSFSPNRALKIREGHQLSFGLRNPNQKRAALWRIFSSNKSVPANRKKRFYANRDPNKQEVGSIFA
jgi:hypothetical protein